MSESILDHPGIQQVLFHPRPDYGMQRTGVFPVAVRVEPEIKLAGRLYPASPDAPAVIFYHGNGEIAADYDEIAGFYNHLDITLLVMDYRGYGASDGMPTAASLLDDAPPTLDQLGEIFSAHQLSPKRRYVMGRSLGSVPAIELAYRAGEQLDGLIIESGFSDTFGLLNRLGVRVDNAEEQRDGFGNSFKLQLVSLPTLIIHGDNDVLIPPDDGEALHASVAAENKRLVLIAGAGHNDILMVGAAEYFQALREFVHAAG
jgi:hypothetical protein